MRGLRDDASIVPYGCGGKAVPGFAGYLWGKAAMHPSVTFGDTSPCRGGFIKCLPPGRLPCKGSWRRQPTEGCGALPCQYPSGLAPPGGRERPPLGGCGIAGFPGRCKHRPLQMRGQGAAGVCGYLWGKAAMHPSVCALRRIHRPVCGARIARRALKHACALRPSNLLRLAFSAAGGARLRSPLQGRLWGEPPPGRLLCKGSWRRQPTEGCGALPCQYSSGPPQGPRRA